MGFRISAFLAIAIIAPGLRAAEPATRPAGESLVVLQLREEEAALRDRIGYVGYDTDSSPRALPQGWDDLEMQLYRLTGEVQAALR